MTTIAFIIPTIGRQSLAATVRSIADQAHPGDIVCVVHDHGPNVELRQGFVAWEGKHTTLGWVLSELDQPGGHYGHVARNWALDHLIGFTHSYSIDDDDCLLPGAVDAMHNAAGERATVFRARWGDGHPAAGTVLWQERALTYGAVGTPMILAPKGRSRWGLAYGGDLDYALALQEEFGAPDWNETIIAEVRPA